MDTFPDRQAPAFRVRTHCHNLIRSPRASPTRFQSP